MELPLYAAYIFTSFAEIESDANCFGRGPEPFLGQYFNQETELHYNWHRYYDSATGRYLTPDPIGLSGGLNLYLYVQGNPVNAIDPDGLSPFHWYFERNLDAIARNSAKNFVKGPFGGVCGQAYSISATWIYDGIFVEACGEHDKCYATCGKTKEQCDSEFYNNGARFYSSILTSIASQQSQEAYDDAQKHCVCDE